VSSAGQQFVADRIPEEEINKSVRTTSSGTFTAETQLDSVAADLVSGRTYRITWQVHLQSSVANDLIRMFIRSTGVGGAQRQLDNMTAPVANVAFSKTISVEFTASSTASHTFAGTAQRQTGTGNISSSQSATQPAYLRVNYVSG
jgi:hypothetical protein